MPCTREPGQFGGVAIPSILIRIAQIRAPKFGDPDRPIAGKPFRPLDIVLELRCIGVTRARVPAVPMDGNEVDTKRAIGVDLSHEVIEPKLPRVVLRRSCWTADPQGRVEQAWPKTDRKLYRLVTLVRLVRLVEPEHVLAARRDQAVDDAGDPGGRPLVARVPRVSKVTR